MAKHLAFLSPICEIWREIQTMYPKMTWNVPQSPRGLEFQLDIPLLLNYGWLGWISRWELYLTDIALWSFGRFEICRTQFWRLKGFFQILLSSV